MLHRIEEEKYFKFREKKKENVCLKHIYVRIVVALADMSGKWPLPVWYKDHFPQNHPQWWIQHLFIEILILGQLVFL